MGVSLQKGGNVSLSKEAGEAGLTSITVGLGWDARTTTGDQFDLDASAIALAGDKAQDDSWFVFYGNLKKDELIVHSGDNLTGQGDGDDEQVKVNLAGIPAEITKIVFPVAIYEADKRSQTFGMVRSAFVRVVNDADGTELARYDLSEDSSTDSCMVFGEVYRNGEEWKFKAVGQGYPGLAGLATDFGVNVA